MSLELSNSNPMVLAKSGLASGNSICLYRGGDDIEISMGDFCHLVEYALTNTDLYPNDPRLSLLEKIKQATLIEGYNGKPSQRITL